MSLYCFASRRVNACYKCLLCMHAPNATILFVYIGSPVIIGTSAIIVVLVITMILVLVKAPPRGMLRVYNESDYAPRSRGACPVFTPSKFNVQVQLNPKP